jgi:hypothetical protein
MNHTTKHALAAFLTAALACCTSWGRPNSLSRELLDQRPSRLQVTLTDGRRLDVYRPRARGDVLLGDTLIYERGGDWARRSPVAIPFDDIRSATPRRFSAGRTAVAAVGVTAAVAGVVAIIAEGISHGIMGGGLGGGSGCAGPKEVWPD